MARRSCVAKVMIADGQITDAGKPGLLYGFGAHSDTNHVTVLFENGAGGTALVNHDMIATTAEGDNTEWVHFNPPIEFTADIYLNLTDSPHVTVLYAQLEA